ncbi:MAG: GlcG protein [Pelagibacterium sp. SCN 64-44]|nr:MAG: GlcG protein [Pelagibacterium sp. SCN 64-44]
MRLTRREARSRHALPIAIAVLDNGGNLVAIQREDGASLARVDIAYAKAWGALGLGIGTRTIAARAAQNPAFIQNAATLLSGRLIPSPGGVIITLTDGTIIGAIGVSGDTGEIDEACALSAIQSLDLLALV